jgi:hypothetical protein
MQKTKIVISSGTGRTIKYFFLSSDSSKQANEVSFEISHFIINSSSLSMEGDFVKNCLIVASQKLCCTTCVKKFKTVSLNL